MGLAAEYTAAQNDVFIQRVQVAMVFFAVNTIASEAVDTPNHANRVAYARDVVARPSLRAAPIALGVIALNAVTDGAALTDQQIIDGVASIWNIYAGAL